MSEQARSGDRETEAGINPSDVRAALEEIVASEELSTSPRLQEILRYIVEEKLAGRGARIKGKTIAADVYGRDLSGAGATDTIVRVEARRLRRLLSQYYEGTGKNASLRIHIDAGGYVPRFEARAGEDTPDSTETDPLPVNPLPPGKPGEPPQRTMAGVVLAVALVLIGGALAIRAGTSPETVAAPIAVPAANPQDAIRSALMEKSPVAVQSLNLAEQARGMLFPVFDPERQKLAIEMFDHAIQLDDTLPDGYAGKAQALATLAFLSPEEMQQRTLMQRAENAAMTAWELGPVSARAHGGIAWIKAFSGDHEGARKHADIAVGLMPNDGYILDIDGVVAILAGDGARAAAASDPRRLRHGEGRFGAPNIWGVANYMLGNYQTVVTAFEAAPSAGAPVSAPSLMFLAAAQDHLGNTAGAEAAVHELQASWPDFPAEFVLGKMFGTSEHAADIHARLVKNGLASDSTKKKDPARNSLPPG